MVRLLKEFSFGGLLIVHVGAGLYVVLASKFPTDGAVSYPGILNIGAGGSCHDKLVFCADSWKGFAIEFTVFGFLGADGMIITLAMLLD